MSGAVALGAGKRVGINKALAQHETAGATGPRILAVSDSDTPAATAAFVVRGGR
jgi:hypothetical protein